MEINTNRYIKSIKNSLKTQIFGKNIFYFDELESTNKFSLEQIDISSVDEGSIYIAERQTNGQGSYGNTWQSNTKLGLYSSLIVHSPYKHNPLTFVPAIAIANMLKEYGIEAHLKWPNDVLVHNKKIAGILCQAKQIESNKFACVVGVGLNINQRIIDFTPELQNKATSMKMITEKKFNTFDILKSYIEYFEKIYLGDCNIIDEWKNRSLMIGANITGKQNGQKFDALVLDITDDGYLKIENNGKIETLMSRSGLDIDANYILN